MGLSIQTISSGGAQSFGGGYTAISTNTYEYLGPMPGRTTRITLLSPTGGGTSNMGVSWVDNSCGYSCDAWYTGPSHDFAMSVTPAVASKVFLIGRNNGGNLGFTNYTVQDTGSDGGVPVVQNACGAANAAVGIATATAGNLLVAWCSGYRHGGTDPVFNAPSGWAAVSAQVTHSGFGIATGRMFYKVAAGTETDFTATGSGITSAETVEVIEYGGITAATLASEASDTTRPNPVTGTFPSGCALAVHVAAWGNAMVLRRADAIGPWLMDYMPVPNESRTGWIGHVPAPAAGSWSWTNAAVGGGDSWFVQSAYFAAGSATLTGYSGVRGIIG